MAKRGNVGKRHANEFMRTHTGRLAGNGMVHDNYDHDSFPLDKPFGYKNPDSYWCIPKDEKEEEPVLTYKLSDEELEKYKNLEVEK